MGVKWLDSGVTEEVTKVMAPQADEHFLLLIT